MSWAKDARFGTNYKGATKENSKDTGNSTYLPRINTQPISVRITAMFPIKLLKRNA